MEKFQFGLDFFVARNCNLNPALICPQCFGPRHICYVEVHFTSIGYIADYSPSGFGTSSNSINSPYSFFITRIPPSSLTSSSFGGSHSVFTISKSTASTVCPHCISVVRSWCLFRPLQQFVYVHAMPPYKKPTSEGWLTGARRGLFSYYTITISSIYLTCIHKTC